MRRTGRSAAAVLRPSVAPALAIARRRASGPGSSAGASVDGSARGLVSAADGMAALMVEASRRALGRRVAGSAHAWSARFNKAARIQPDHRSEEHTSELQTLMRILIAL